MTVSLIASATVLGSAFAEILSGSGTGYKFATVEASQTPPTQPVHIRQDMSGRLTPLKITNLKVYLKAYSQSYGGDYSATADLVKVIEQGYLGSGFQIDFNRTGTDFATFSQLSSTLGTSMTNAITIPTSAMYQTNAGTPIAPVGPVAGEIHPLGDVKGDAALLKCRWGIPLSETAPGRRQIDLAFLYNFTT